jgi:hypothetical protein
MAANNDYASKKTSLITIQSSAHGRLHPKQRDIDKQDLQRALKNGKYVMRRGHHNWYVQYDGISFEMDPTLKHKIMAFPSPLPEINIGIKAVEANEKMNCLLEQKPDVSTLHTVIVVDNSSSMLSRKNNVHLYHDSQNAAFSMTALEFIAEQLLSNTAVNTDLVSLVKFGEIPRIEFLWEPMSWPAYNKILGH